MVSVKSAKIVGLLSAVYDLSASHTGLLMARNTRRKLPGPAQIDEAEQQIRDYSRAVKFTVTEYSFEFMVQKLEADRYYVPAYQRELEAISKLSFGVDSRGLNVIPSGCQSQPGGSHVDPDHPPAP